MTRPHWFERYRQAYRRWWDKTAEGLDEEQREEFEEFASADAMTPLPPAALDELVHVFPHLQSQLRAFLAQFGVGSFNFPDHYGDNQPGEYRVFDLEEIEERIGSIRAQAELELEQLPGAPECDAHGDDHEQCKALLSAVRDNPRRFYPFFGPDGEHNFVYILQGAPKDGVVANWYHDYPICELLDGSAETPDVASYGEDLINMTVDARNPL